jgi:hypothetical protein
MLVFAGFSVGHSFFLGATVSFSSYLGMVNYLAISKRRSHNILELIGAGTALGTFAPAVFGLLLRSFLSVPSFVGFIVFTLVSILNLSQLKNNDLFHDLDDHKHIAITGAASSAAVAQFIPHFYILSLFFCLFALSQFSNQWTFLSGFFRRYFPRLVFLGLFIGTVAYILFKVHELQLWKSITYVDQIFDETQSWSIAKYGATDNAFAVGFDMPGHTLTHAWAGIIQQILDTPVFMSSGMGGIVLGVMGTTSLIGGFALRSSRTVLSLLGAYIVWTLQMSLVDQLGISANARISNNLSLLWFTFAIVLILEFKQDLVRGPYWIIPLFVGLTGLSKLHWGVYLVGVFGLLSLIEAIRFRKIGSLLIFSLSGLVLLLVYLIFLRGMNSFYSPKFDFSISTALVFYSVFISRSFGFFTDQTDRSFTTLRHTLFVAMIFFVPLIAITGGANQETYFVNCSTIIIAMMAGPHILRMRVQMGKTSKAIIVSFFIFVLLFSLISIAGYWKFFVRSSYSELWSLVFELVKIRDALYLVLLLVVTTLIVLSAQTTRKLSEFGVYFALLALTGNFAIMIAQSTQSTYTHRIYGSQLVELRLSNQQLEAGSWLRSNTESQVVVATNHYCQIPVKVGQRVPIVPEECRHRNLNSWVAAISHRRMLLEAPIVNVFGPGRTYTKEMTDRYNISLQFGSSPTYKHRLSLKEYGVEYFVLDKTLSADAEWSAFGRVVFENQLYMIIRI